MRIRVLSMHEPLRIENKKAGKNIYFSGLFPFRSHSLKIGAREMHE